MKCLEGEICDLIQMQGVTVLRGDGQGRLCEVVTGR